MNAKQKIKKYRFGGMTPRLHGHTKIVFTDKFGRETVKFDKDNLVTNAVQKIFESNYFGSIDYSNLMPAIRKAMGGVVLFENSLGSDASDVWIPNSFSNPITAHAGQTVPASLADDITRGLPNSAASTAIVNGYKMVWNFPETQGNGDISAVGLCHTDFGDYALKDSDFQPLEMISNDSIKSVSFGEDDNRKKVLNFFDPVNGYNYSLINNDTTVGANGQAFNNEYNTFTVVRRKNSLLNNLAVDMSHYLGNDEAAETFTLSYTLGQTGSPTNVNLPSIFIDYTNNLLWFSFCVGTATGADTFDAAAFDMTAFTHGANLTPVKTLQGSSCKGSIMGSNLPLQSIIKESPDGYLPAVYWDGEYKIGLASYDDSTEVFALENITGISTGLNKTARFPENLALGNYFYIHSVRHNAYSKLIEFNVNGNTNYSYDVTAPTLYISPYYVEDDNPIIGASQWSYAPATGFTMGKSGTAINKLYLATKNDLPATITKTAANSMRVEYTLTYV